MIVIGKTVLFSCSGIAIECKGHVTKFVTSARLVRAISDTKLTKKGDDNSRVGAVNQALLIFSSENPLLTCLIYITVILCNFFLLCNDRFKYAMKAMKYTKVFWQNII